MNKYPGFYRASYESVYLYADKYNHYSFEREAWYVDKDKEGCRTKINITAEYLANTYGKVESKDHAEFIVKLAEANGFTQCHSANVGEEGSFMFCSDGEFGIYDKTHNQLVNMQDRKLITIPLPPKDKPMESQKEWPQVGDKALTSSKQKVSVLAIHGGEAWVKYDGTPIGTGYASVRSATLSKPPTPEQELFESFWKEVGLFMNQSNLNKKIFESAFINNITKKPQ